MKTDLDCESQGIVEEINAEPLDFCEIAKLWKLYTTTKRRILDPMSERLENYYWRIWGSRRRQLRGTGVAGLFMDISNSKSFVSLRGPANRDEGTHSLDKNIRHGPGAASIATLNQSRLSITPSSTASKTAVVVQPQSILKKTGGNSTTGPRPTARFISPHDSDFETHINSFTKLQQSPHSHMTPTLVDSMGQLDLSDTASSVLPQVTGAKGRDTEDVNQSLAFVKISVPPISALIPEESLASKSQLTLLLEDGAKCGI
ncbi:hypothetical protein IFR05_016466 [Cadophora sp. M221]|nr:hypothetical protein IFR05_016466 [Cadophora sp. M221]